MKDAMECDWETLAMIERMMKTARLQALKECLAIAHGAVGCAVGEAIAHLIEAEAKAP